MHIHMEMQKDVRGVRIRFVIPAQRHPVRARCFCSCTAAQSLRLLVHEQALMATSLSVFRVHKCSGSIVE